MQVDGVRALSEAMDSEEGQGRRSWGHKAKEKLQLWITGQILRNNDQGGELGM